MQAFKERRASLRREGNCYSQVGETMKPNREYDFELTYKQSDHLHYPRFAIGNRLHLRLLSNLGFPLRDDSR
jgi:hypothetical protein